MKKHKKKRGKMWIIIVLLLAGAIAVLAVTGTNNKKQQKHFIDTEEIVSKQKCALEEIALCSETVEMSYKEGILKIDMITPSLDTCSFKCIIYNLNNQEILSTADFTEGAWVTGLTKNGYYAADVLGKSVFLYDRSGKQVFGKTFYEDGLWAYAAAFSYDESSFAYVSLPDNIIHIWKLSSQTETCFAPKFSIREILSFEDGVLTVLGVQGETAAIDINSFDTKIISDDRRCSYMSEYYSLGMTENNYVCSSAEKTVYVPFSAIDEMVVGMAEDVFATTVMQEADTLIRVYYLKKQKFYEAKVEENVESIILLDGEMLVLAGDVQNKSHRIIKMSYEGLEAGEFEVLDEDTAIIENPEVEDVPHVSEVNAKIINDVPMIKQFPEYPTGCEAVSTVMAMQYLGEDISVKSFIDGYLPQSSEFWFSDGKKYGPSPYECFIGTPSSRYSYGCMATVIEKSLKDYYGDSADIKNKTGTELPELCEAYISNDIPVILWATINMQETSPTNSWYLSDGKRFTWPGNEHCMVLVGFDLDYYYFNDPYSGQLTSYKRTVVESRYAELGKQCIVIEK